MCCSIIRSHHHITSNHLYQLSTACMNDWLDEWYPSSIYSIPIFLPSHLSMTCQIKYPYRNELVCFFFSRSGIYHGHLSLTFGQGGLWMLEPWLAPCEISFHHLAFMIDCDNQRLSTVIDSLVETTRPPCSSIEKSIK